MFILWLICIVSPNFYSPRQTCLSHKWVIPPPSHTEQLPKPLSLDISTIALVCIVSEPCLDKSEEFNNHSFLELFLVPYRAFLSQKKNIKADRLFINLFWNLFFCTVQVCRGAAILCISAPIFSCLLFFGDTSAPRSGPTKEGGGNLKIKKGGGSMLQVQVFLKGGGAGTFPIYFFFKIYHFCI